MLEKTTTISTTLMKILMDLLDTNKLITESTEAHLYMMVKEKLYRVILGHCTAYPTGWKPGLGTIVAAHVAHTKRFFTSNDGIDKTLFRYGVGRKGAAAHKVICIPIADPKGKVYGVLELCRHEADPPYSQTEIDISVSICAWASSSIYRNSTKTLINRDESLHQDFLFSLNKYSAGGSDFSSFISATMEYIQKNIGADGVIYSEVLKTNPYIVVDYFSRGNNSHHLERSNKKRRLDPINDKEVLYCLKSSDIYRRKELLSQSNEDVPSDSNIKKYESVLYCPVFELKRPAGVAVFWKKDIEGGFTWYDELISCHSLASLLIAYNLHRLSERNFMKRMMCANIFDMVIHQLRPCPHDHIFLNRYMFTQPKFPDNFFKFSYYPNENDSMLQLINYLVDMFRLILGQNFLQANPRLGEFVIMVANSYRDMPYHNFMHAFATTHAMFNIIIRNKDKIYPIEMLCLLMATYCHDMDHPGVSNAFLKLIDSYMWQLYEEPPTLEMHHSYLALHLIQYCQLFQNMKRDKYKMVLSKIKQHILATDLTNHFKIKSEMHTAMSETGFQWADPDHRESLKCILMTTCDLNVSFKHPEDALGIVCDLYGEFYAQGDQEKKRGVVPLSIMDRSMSDTIPNGQVTFLSVICLPCFEILKEILPNCDEIITTTHMLKEFWRKMADERPPYPLLNISNPQT